jgi:hypothetical protein
VRSRHSGASESDNEDTPAGELGSTHCWVMSLGDELEEVAVEEREAEAQKIAQMIQKRTMIFVSDHAFISK